MAAVKAVPYLFIITHCFIATLIDVVTGSNNSSLPIGTILKSSYEVTDNIALTAHSQSDTLSYDVTLAAHSSLAIASNPDTSEVHPSSDYFSRSVGIDKAEVHSSSDYFGTSVNIDTAEVHPSSDYFSQSESIDTRSWRPYAARSSIISTGEDVRTYSTPLVDNAFLANQVTPPLYFSSIFSYHSSSSEIVERTNIMEDPHEITSQPILERYSTPVFPPFVSSPDSIHPREPSSWLISLEGTSLSHLDLKTLQSSERMFASVVTQVSMMSASSGDVQPALSSFYIGSLVNYVSINSSPLLSDNLSPTTMMVEPTSHDYNISPSQYPHLQDPFLSASSPYLHLRDTRLSQHSTSEISHVEDSLLVRTQIVEPTSQHQYFEVSASGTSHFQDSLVRTQIAEPISQHYEVPAGVTTYFQDSLLSTPETVNPKSQYFTDSASEMTRLQDTLLATSLYFTDSANEIAHLQYTLLTPSEIVMSTSQYFTDSASEMTRLQDTLLATSLYFTDSANEIAHLQDTLLTPSEIVMSTSQYFTGPVSEITHLLTASEMPMSQYHRDLASETIGLQATLLSITGSAHPASYHEVSVSSDLRDFTTLQSSYSQFDTTARPEMLPDATMRQSAFIESLGHITASTSKSASDEEIIKYSTVLDVENTTLHRDDVAPAAATTDHLPISASLSSMIVSSTSSVIDASDVHTEAEMSTGCFSCSLPNSSLFAIHYGSDISTKHSFLLSQTLILPSSPIAFFESSHELQGLFSDKIQLVTSSFITGDSDTSFVHAVSHSLSVNASHSQMPTALYLTQNVTFMYEYTSFVSPVQTAGPLSEHISFQTISPQKLSFHTLSLQASETSPSHTVSVHISEDSPTHTLSVHVSEESSVHTVSAQVSETFAVLSTPHFIMSTFTSSAMSTEHLIRSETIIDSRTVTTPGLSSDKPFVFPSLTTWLILERISSPWNYSGDQSFTTSVSPTYRHQKSVTSSSHSFDQSAISEIYSAFKPTLLTAVDATVTATRLSISTSIPLSTSAPNISTSTPVTTSTPDISTSIPATTAPSDVVISFAFSGDCERISQLQSNEQVNDGLIDIISNITRIQDRHLITIGKLNCNPNSLPVLFQNVERRHLFWRLNQTEQTNSVYALYINKEHVPISFTHFEELQNTQFKKGIAEVEGADIAVIATATCICVVLVTAGLIIFVREFYYKKISERFTFSDSPPMSTKTEHVALTCIPKHNAAYNDSEMTEERSVDAAYFNSSYDADYSTIDSQRKISIDARRTSDLSSKGSVVNNGSHMTGAVKNENNQERSTQNKRTTKARNSGRYGLVIGLLGYSRKDKTQIQPDDSDEDSNYAVPDKKAKVQGISIKRTLSSPSNPPSLPPTHSSSEARTKTNSATAAVGNSFLPASRHLKMVVKTTVSDSHETLLPQISGAQDGAGTDAETGTDNPLFAKKGTPMTGSTQSFHF